MGDQKGKLLFPVTETESNKEKKDCFFPGKDSASEKPWTLWASQVVVVIKKNLPANAGDVREAGSICEFDLCIGKIPWRRGGQPTRVFWP